MHEAAAAHIEVMHEDGPSAREPCHDAGCVSAPATVPGGA